MLSRRVVVVAVAIAVPPLLVLQFYVGLTRTWMAAMGAVAASILIAHLAFRIDARRVRRLMAFVETLVDSSIPRPKLIANDDEVGELARSLSRVASKIDAMVVRLSTELTRREAILSSMNEAVVAVDARLNITFCNNSFIQAVSGNLKAEGQPLLRVVRDPALFQMLTHVIDSGETVHRRLLLSPGDGRVFDAYATPLAGSSPRGAIAIFQDVTPLERLERAKRDFIANVSHELRTPLATITGYAETLLDGGLEDERNRRRFVEIIQANGVRLNNIAADLLILSELEAGRTDVKTAPIFLDEVIREAIVAIQPAAVLNQVSLGADPIPRIQVMGHRFRFEQALLNLLDNAVKFNKICGRVRIAVVMPAEDRVEISVSDTGIGIPAEDLSRVFERFYRVDKARSRQVGGTGLGLSIVKHTIEQMNGSMAVESELGKGSRFIIRLPRLP